MFFRSVKAESPVPGRHRENTPLNFRILSSEHLRSLEVILSNKHADPAASPHQYHQVTHIPHLVGKTAATSSRTFWIVRSFARS